MNNINNPSASSALTTQTDVTVSRALDGTVYHNTKSTPIFVLISVGVSQNGILSVKSDATAIPTLQIGYIENDNLLQSYQSIGFWVLPGNYYKATKTNAISLTVWIEYS